MNVFAPGAQVTSNATTTTPTVRAGHGFPAGQTLDCIVVRGGSMVANTFTTATYLSATSLTLGASLTVVAGDYIVNLGNDTSGGVNPSWDGSTVQIYTDMAGAGTAISESKITTPASGEYEYFSRSTDVWELVRVGNTVFDIVPGAFTAQSPNIYNAMNFGATGDGSTDDTTAIQAAIDAAEGFSASIGATVYFPPGTYKVTSTLTIQNMRVRLFGSGKWTTTFNFVPASNDVPLFWFGYQSSSVLYQNAIRDFVVKSTDSTLRKVAIRLDNVSEFEMDSIATSSFTGGTGVGSIALQIRGREFIWIEDCDLYSDTPVSIEGNAYSTIDLDHSTFRNMIFGDSSLSHPLISVATGINLTNITFDGAQSWVGGSYGFYWLDTTTSQISQNLRFDNVRWEQATNATGYAIYISHNFTMRGLVIVNLECGGVGGANAMYFRKVDRANIEQPRFTGTAGKVFIDADNTNSNFLITNPYNFASNGSTTLGMTSYVLIDANTITGSVGTLLTLAQASSVLKSVDGLARFTMSNRNTGTSARARLQTEAQTAACYMESYSDSYSDATLAGNSIIYVDGSQKLYLGTGGSSPKVTIDSGTAKLGIGVNPPTQALDVVGAVRFSTHFISTPTSTQSITAVGNTISASAAFVMISADGVYTLTSTPTVANGLDGQHLRILNVGTNAVTIQDQGTLASSNLRLTAAGVTIGPRQSVQLVYSSTVGDWVQVGTLVTVI